MLLISYKTGNCTNILVTTTWKYKCVFCWKQQNCNALKKCNMCCLFCRLHKIHNRIIMVPFSESFSMIWTKQLTSHEIQVGVGKFCTSLGGEAFVFVIVLALCLFFFVFLHFWKHRKICEGCPSHSLSLTVNVIIRVSQFVKNNQLCHWSHSSSISNFSFTETWTIKPQLSQHNDSTSTKFGFEGSISVNTETTKRELS